MDKVEAGLAKIDGAQAEALKANPVWNDIQKRMRHKLEVKRLSCKTATEPELAADIIRLEQLLSGMLREIERVIQNKNLAELKLVDLEKKAKRAEPRQIKR